MKDNIIQGKDIVIEEMPQGMFLSQTLNGNVNYIRVASVEDAKLIIDSLQLMVKVFKEDE